MFESPASRLLQAGGKIAGILTDFSWGMMVLARF
jgi:hypothetical protein